MKALFLLVVAQFVAACGGGAGTATADSPPAPPAGPVGTDRYSVSRPLVDNAGASAYKVLLMGNSHAAGLYQLLEELLVLGQPGKPIDVHLSATPGFLDDRVNDGSSERDLESDSWTHVILQGQKYSTSGSLSYPTDAAEYWIRGSKLQGATPIMFPEHPREGNDWEGRTLWELHTGIADRENTCVAPVGLVWDEVIFRDPALVLHQPDGNHASPTGLLLTALVFYPIITGQAVESLPELSRFNVSAATEAIMRESVSSVLYSSPPCRFDR
jgi:hypothetical protein